MPQYQRGDEVLLLAYGGERITRRVWRDIGRGVLICSEEAYQEAVRTGAAPQCVGWPREDVLELIERPPAVEEP